MPGTVANRRAHRLPAAENSAGSFVTTNWSLVVKAGQTTDGGSQSLAQLCELYWFPLYAYLRRLGSPQHDAEDLLQSFFAWLIDEDLIKRADRDRGRFRAFLRVAIRQFCARENRRARAQKRRPASPVLSLDFAQAESRYDQGLADCWTPERVFDHSWALTVLEMATLRLRVEYQQAGRLKRFEALAPFLAGGGEAEREKCTQALGMSPAAFNMALSRLRRQFAKILRDEVARTVDHDDQIDDELRQMRAALAPS